jgi:hypothetical protein
MGLSDYLNTPPRVSPPPLAADLICKIDISGTTNDDRGKAQVGEVRQAIEAAVRTRKKDGKWRCAAVTRGARNPDLIKVICRDETELSMVRETVRGAECIPGAKVLRDRVYPVKIDGANRSAVLDAHGNLLPGVVEALSQENEVIIARMNWLSDKINGKAYGSMVIYVTKESEARRLLEGKYFHLTGESARTSVFEPKVDPVQCYNCWDLGHKAFTCKEAQKCGRCAGRGHYHRQCQATEPRCVQCRGQHEAFSRTCRSRQLHRNEQ